MAIIKLTDDQCKALKKGCPALKTKYDVGEAVNQIIEKLNGGSSPTVTITDRQAYELDKMCPLESSKIGSKIKELLESMTEHKTIAQYTAGQVAWMDSICYGLKTAKLGSKLYEIIEANNGTTPPPTPSGEVIYEYPNPTITFEYNEDTETNMAMIEGITEEVLAKMLLSSTFSLSFNGVEYFNNAHMTIGFDGAFTFGGSSEETGILNPESNAPFIGIFYPSSGIFGLIGFDEIQSDVEYDFSFTIYSNELTDGYIIKDLPVMVGNTVMHSEAVGLDDYLPPTEDQQLIKTGETYEFTCDGVTEILTATDNDITFVDNTIEVTEGKFYSPTAYYDEDTTTFIGLESKGSVGYTYLKVITMSIKKI